MTQAIQLELSRIQAQELTIRIKNAVEHLWELIHKAHAGKAWKALGYGTWREYVETEFDMSKSTSYTLIGHAAVVYELSDAAGTSRTLDVSDSTALRIKPFLPDAVAEVRESIENGVTPQEAVKQVVQKYGAVPPKQAAMIARHTGVPTPGTDNVVHDWRTPEEDMRIREHQTRVHAVYEALERLSQLPDARQIMEEIPPWQFSRVDQHLEGAYMWLNKFKELWIDELQQNAGKRSDGLFRNPWPGNDSGSP